MVSPCRLKSSRLAPYFDFSCSRICEEIYSLERYFKSTAEEVEEEDTWVGVGVVEEAEEEEEVEVARGARPHMSFLCMCRSRLAGTCPCTSLTSRFPPLKLILIGNQVLGRQDRWMEVVFDVWALGELAR